MTLQLKPFQTGPLIFLGYSMMSAEVGRDKSREEDEISLFKKYQYTLILTGRR